MLADKDARGMLELLEPVVDAVVVTRTPRRARCRPTSWRDRGRGLRRGPGARRAGDLPDAIEAAVALAEADVDAELSGVGVLITGSVVTVADARKLLRR